MIKIRKAKLVDAEGISELVKVGLKRNNWLYTGTNRYYPKQLKILKKSLSLNSTEQIFVATDKNKIIGSASYYFKKEGRVRHRIDLGWGLHPDYQGRGIGTKLLKLILAEAVKKGFKRAEAEIAVKNKASWKMILKCGFKIEGIKKKALMTDDGKYIDTYIVGKILK